MTIDLDMAIGALQGVVAGGVLLVLLYGPWQRVCTDFARDVIFEQRDALFDVAAAGGLTFGTAPYETIRSGLNALIRLAHRLTLIEIIAFGLAKRRATLPLAPSGLREAIEAIENTETRTKVRKLVNKAELAVLVMVFVRSPGFVFLLAPMLLVTSIRVGLARAWKRARQALSRQIDTAIAAETRS